MDIIAQKFKRPFNSKLSKAIAFYSVISAFNSLNLTKKQVELLAYTHIRGTISSLSAKKDFVNTFGSSIDSINNMISKLYKKKLLYKVGDTGKIKVAPIFSKMDFENPEIVVILTIANYKETVNES